MTRSQVDSTTEHPPAYASSSAVEERFLPSGEEAGTSPSDRRFRPDVEGLRAIAVLLVVLFHANVPGLTGGYVGVDVFFVISGFVITGLLLRERDATSRTSILNFYARRMRRILPAATVVILITVLASYSLLGSVSGNSTADDGRWAAAFLSNLHFESVGTSYLAAFRPPSLLQNYWSLSVEEQFYIVFPTLFLLVFGARARLSPWVRMSSVLGIVICASYSLSIYQTAANPAAAYFSPLTRAWELALGASVAIATPWLRTTPWPLASAISWTGLGATVVAACVFNAGTAYPGSLVAIPVVGAAMVIAGGTAAPPLGAETVLGRLPFQWLGRRSYSFYLIHWPLLIIAAERVGRSSLSVTQNLLVLVLALALSAVSYSVIENPVRHWKLPSTPTVIAGVGVIITTILILSLAINVNSSHYNVPVDPARNASKIVGQVGEAPRIHRLPVYVEPPLSEAATDFGGNYEGYRCQPTPDESVTRICTLGDPKGSRLMIVYGDSHALMWIPAFESIAKSQHWRLVVLGKPACPAALVVVANSTQVGETQAPNDSCTGWHRWAVRTVNRLHPDKFIVSQDNDYVTPDSSTSRSQGFTELEWQRGVTELFQAISVPTSEKVFLGNIPRLAQSAPICLAAHLHDVQKCATPLHSAVAPLNNAEQAAAADLHVRYVNTVPWFCSATCTAVIGNYIPYLDRYHVTGTYARYIQEALAQSLGFGVAG